VTIARRMAIGYAAMSVACLVLVTWLGYHEFVEEPAEFAARGLTDVHKDTGAEFFTVCFLAAVPLLLGFGWWWMRRVLAPLQTLAATVENIDTHNLQQALPGSAGDDEVDKLSRAFNSMAARLDASFRRIHEFTLHASHELKTPLTVMRAHLETALREGESLPQEQTTWIDGQLDEINRLTRIVDSLTLLTKADAGLVGLAQEQVSLGELVKEAVEDTEALAQPHGLQVRLKQCVETVIAGDRHRLRQLLLILTDNAVKYSRSGGSIDIALRQTGDTAEVQITNTSSSLEPGTLERVFDRFVRGENARGEVEGCGLGLSIARWIAEAHGGSIQLLRETEGRISAVVKLPRRIPQRAPSSVNT